MSNLYVIDEGMISELSSKLITLETVTDNILYKNHSKESFEKEMESIRDLQRRLDRAETLEGHLREVERQDEEDC